MGQEEQVLPELQEISGTQVIETELKVNPPMHDVH